MRIILLIMIGLSLGYADFSRSNAITKVLNSTRQPGSGSQGAVVNSVLDSKTGLEWQDDAVGDTMDWVEAIKYCESLELDSNKDWRLPNINELKTIIDRSRYNPAIVSTFEHTSSGYYWSSTTYEYYHEFAWYVSFSYGYVYRGYKGTSRYVRCVRDGQRLDF